MLKPVEREQRLCPTCGGFRRIMVKEVADGKEKWRQVACPTCKGSGQSGYLTK